MMDKKKINNIISALLLIVSAGFFVGTLTFLHTCGKTEDGSWMTCHWAGEMIKVLAGSVCLLSLASLILNQSKTRMGISLGILLTSIASAITPGIIISTCMMPDMRCNAVTRPGALVFGISLAILSVVQFVISYEDK